MPSEIILGTVQLGTRYGINNTSGQLVTHQILKILNVAYGNAITTLDTADSYGNIHEFIGDFHRLNSTKKFKIINKFFLTPAIRSDPGKYVRTTIKKLNVPDIHVLMFHRFGDFTASKDVIRKLEALKQECLISNIGVSVYSNDEFKTCILHESIDVIQLPFNLLDNMNKRGKLIELAKENGKILHVRSVFLQGLFFMSLERIPERLKLLTVYLQKLAHISQKFSISMEKLALNYVYHNNKIDGILIGVDNINQLLLNLTAVQSDFAPSIQEHINEINVQEEYLLNPVNW